MQRVRGEVFDQIRNGIRHCLCARHCAQSFAGVMSFSPQKPNAVGHTQEEMQA